MGDVHKILGEILKNGVVGQRALGGEHSDRKQLVLEMQCAGNRTSEIVKIGYQISLVVIWIMGFVD